MRSFQRNCLRAVHERKEAEGIYSLGSFLPLDFIWSEFAPWQAIFLLLTQEMRLKQSAEVTIEGQRIPQISQNTTL